MKERSITGNSIAFIYYEIPDFYTCVFLIEKKTRIFVIDTFCGSVSMEPVLKHIAKVCPEKEVIVVNSHFHWDHVWGNVAFKDKTIIGHRFCHEDLLSNWEHQINNHGQYISGEVDIVLPSLTFDKSIFFPDDQIEIFHSPGHTRDCISVFDHDEGSLYVGDNVEEPIIYVGDPDIETYVATLNHYLSLSTRKIFSSHTLEITDKEIQRTIDYLIKIKSGIDVDLDTAYERRVHSENLAVLKSPTY
ncbi:MAG: MBL fold metallo-hydrolase [Candidatus Riflebacteria bacterium]|nr:MBL fold metallo-hydrolase [Candidatus Riflebacteria bacterium]